MADNSYKKGGLIMKMWIARDPSGQLELHSIKPYLAYGLCWNNEDKNWMRLRDEDYPEVTFENSPMEVELILKK